MKTETQLTLQQKKDKMKAYKDFFGGDIMYTDEIDDAVNDEDLNKIFWKYHSHIEDLCSDASSHLDHFKRTLNLDY